MQRRQLQPDVVTYTTVIDAYAKANDFDRALHYFDEMLERGIQVDHVTINSLLDGIYENRTLSRNLWLRSVSKGLYSNFEFVQDSMPLLDLHGFSEGAAETAVLWWLEKIRRECERRRVGQVVIVTGKGVHRAAWQSSDFTEASESHVARRWVQGYSSG